MCASVPEEWWMLGVFFFLPQTPPPNTCPPKLAGDCELWQLPSSLCFKQTPNTNATSTRTPKEHWEQVESSLMSQWVADVAGWMWISSHTCGLYIKSHARYFYLTRVTLERLTLRAASSHQQNIPCNSSCLFCWRVNGVKNQLEAEQNPGWEMRVVRWMQQKKNCKVDMILKNNPVRRNRYGKK